MSAIALHQRIENAISAIRRGLPVVVADHPGRENEGDLIIAAEKITRTQTAFFVRHTTGIICVSLLPDRLDELRLPLMVHENTESHRTAFTVTVDWIHGTTTGVSAEDRTATLRALADPTTTSDGFARPGHIFPLRAHPAGVLARPGHTEAAIDLVRFAGLFPAGVLCEIVNEDGSMARGTQLEAFAREHHLPFITIPELIEYRRQRERQEPRGFAPRATITTLEAELEGAPASSEYPLRHDNA
ncbi:MAG TPA: 3,4-dihydroxy-2-butanone-4-phosphate synthase, partial [Opitutaceae bacterium]